MRVEAEGKEMIMRSENGDVAIIPKNRVAEMKFLIKEGDDDGVDALINSLPRQADYAEGGSLYTAPQTPVSEVLVEEQLDSQIQEVEEDDSSEDAEEDTSPII